MVDVKSKMRSLVLLFYIGIIIVKDYLVNLFVYMNDSGKGLTYISLKSALFQTITLLCGALLFFRIKYRVMCKEAIYNGVEAESFSKIGGFRKPSWSESITGILIGTLSYIAFNSLKNVYKMFAFCFFEKVDFVTEKIMIETGTFLFLIFIFAFLMVVGEELVYRSMLFYNLQCVGKKKSLLILFCVTVFAAAHGSVEQMLQAVFLALLLCIIMNDTKSVFLCIIIHMTYNVIGTVVTYYCPSLMLDLFSASYDMLKVDSLIIAVKLLLVAVVAATLLYVLVQSRGVKEKRERGEEVVKNDSLKNGILLGIIMMYSIYKIYKTLQ